MAPLDDFDPDRDLVLELTLKADRAFVWRGWTDADLMKEWFAPAPFTVPVAEIDLKLGGVGRVEMAGPDGMRIPAMWTYVALEPERRIISSSVGEACGGMLKSPALIMDLEFDDAPGGGTLYRAHVRHWTKADRDTHAEMGFEAGWTMAARQLEALAGTMKAAA